jgi:hypothetical protein
LLSPETGGFRKRHVGALQRAFPERVSQMHPGAQRLQENGAFLMVGVAFR